MSDFAGLQRELLTAIAQAPDEAALEAVRVSALGKKGRISELLKSLGSMTPEERREKGPLINGLRDEVQAAVHSRKQALAGAALEARLSAEKLDLSLPLRESAVGRGRVHPISQVVDELTAVFADMGFSIAEGPGYRDRLAELHRLELPARSSGARHAGHLFLSARRQGGAQGAAHAHIACADPHDDVAKTADPRSYARAAPIAAIRPTKRICPCFIRSRGL